MNAYLAEFIGTAMLILLGDGVVANVLLKKSKGENSGWIVITMGWAMAVFVGVFCVARYSGAHLNPAITLALALSGKFPWVKVIPYILAQLAGAMLGAVLVFLSYRQHFQQTDNPDLIRAVFCTAPNIRHELSNMITEIIGTFVLVFAALYLSVPDIGLNSINALPISLVVLGIGLSLGGPTGYAINPARDLGPRIVHAILPIPNKGHSDWKYSWIPILGPVLGAMLAAGAYFLLS